MTETKANFIKVPRPLRREIDRIAKVLKDERGGHFYGPQVIEELVKFYNEHKIKKGKS